MVWQHLLHSWLRQEAGRRVQDAVVSAASGEAVPSEEAAESSEAEPPVCHVGVVVDQAAVAGSFVDRLDGAIKTHGHGFLAYAGGLRGRGVIVVQSEPGLDQIRNATRSLLSAHQPQWILSAGLASGLSTDLQRGDIVLANGLANVAGRRLAIDVKPDESTKTKPQFVVGRVLTLTAPVVRSSDKRQYGQLHEAMAADTCGLAVADACRDASVRCLAVCAILDAVDDQLPDELRNLNAQESVAGKLGAATGALFKRPSAAKEWWNVKEETLTTADRLAKFLDGMIRQLIPRDQPRATDADRE